MENTEVNNSMTEERNKKKNFTLRIKDKHGFGGGWAVLALMLVMLAVTLSFCYIITSGMADSVETLCKGEKDVEILGIDDSSGFPIPDTNHITQKTFNWCAGIMMSFMGLAILGIAFSYFTGIFNPEVAVKAKAMGMKLILAICISPFLWIPLYYVIKINQALCTSFIGMSGMDISTEWCAHFAGGFNTYTLVPMFALAIAGLAVTFYCILLFRLVFIMITYAVAPMAIILCVFPQTREFGGKILKIFFESVFALLFLDMGLIFCFKIFSSSIGLSNPLGFVFAVAGLAAPIAVYKLLFNPISGAVGGAASAGVGAITGVVAGGMGIRGAAMGLSRGRGDRGGGAGAGATGKKGTDTADKVADAGAGMAQADPHGFGALVGLGVGGMALAFKGGKKGIQSARKKYGEYKQDKKALGGQFATIDASKPGAPATVLKEKCGPFAITRMQKQANKMGHGEEFRKTRAERKAYRIVQHNDEEKQRITERMGEKHPGLQQRLGRVDNKTRKKLDRLGTSAHPTDIEKYIRKKYIRKTGLDEQKHRKI